MISDEEAKNLLEENKKLKKELEKLRKEFEEYKSKHALTVSELRKALKIKSDSHNEPKPLGAPKGHVGYSRHIPERIDYIKVLNPRRCPHCNTILGATQEIRSRCVTDIKLISKTRTTKYEIHRKYCPRCKKLVEMDVPEALPHARFGLNLMLLVMYLKLGLRLSCQKIVEYFMDMHNLEISEGEIIVILRQLVGAFGDHYCYLEKLVKLAKIKHSDTTGWRINGKNYFAWVFIGCGVVLYKIRKRNNHKAALCFLGKQNGNILVVDRHSAFRLLAEKTGFLLQLCWSHILQDSKELAEIFGAEGTYVHRKLKDIFTMAKSLNHKGNHEMVEQLKAEIFQLVLRHYNHTQVRKFVNSLYFRDAENLFRFVTNPNIDSTNNVSERELRTLVIMRKITNGSRSTRGANATAMLLSVVQTLRFNKQNVLQGLQGILKNTSGY
jgi:phage FluMu protein Com